jgi:hypothetical protein
VVGTARWVAKNYIFCYSNDKTIKDIINELIIIRCSELHNADKEHMLLNFAPKMKGLRDFVIMLLLTESHYLDNTERNKSTINNVVREVLVKKGIPLEVIDKQNLTK